MQNSDSMLDTYRSNLLQLLKEKAYRRGDFKLSSGKKSPHYVNCKPVTLSGEGLSLFSPLMLQMVEKESVAVAGLTLGADPLVVGVSLNAWMEGRELDALIIRKEPKGHGTAAWIEGHMPPEGSRITILEDVITTGGSAIKAAEKVVEAGYEVKNIVSIVDRLEGGEDAIIDAGFVSYSIFDIKEIAGE